MISGEYSKTPVESLTRVDVCIAPLQETVILEPLLCSMMINLNKVEDQVTTIAVPQPTLCQAKLLDNYC
jgi:hypothetical protein